MSLALLLPLILQGIQAAISAAPGVIDIVNKGKALISALFTAKVITKQMQDALHAHIDSIDAMVQAGIVPNSWQVQPDPTTPAAQAQTLKLTGIQ
jgi:hypothetical protein